MTSVPVDQSECSGPVDQCSQVKIWADSITGTWTVESGTENAETILESGLGKYRIPKPLAQVHYSDVRKALWKSAPAEDAKKDMIRHALKSAKKVPSHWLKKKILKEAFGPKRHHFLSKCER
jgi:hypothetical protein